MARYDPESARDFLEPWIVRDEGDETRAFCPIDEEPGASSSPSASFNFADGVWHCMKADHGGSIQALVADLRSQTGGTVIHRVTSRPAATAPAEPFPYDESDVEAWNTRLLADAVHLQQLLDERGVNTATVCDFMLGWDGDRFTIPVFDADGALVNVRRYRPGAASQKMLNVPGHGAHRVFGLEVFETSDTILWTAGEMDRILATQEGWPAVTQTAGEKYFDASWGPLFRDKVVYVVYDADDIGRAGAEKAIETIRLFARETYRVDIPEVRKGYDVTDVLMESGPEELARLVAGAENRSREPDAPMPTTGLRVSLQETMAESLQNTALEVVVSVSGKQAEPWTAPRTVTATCQMNKGTICGVCPVGAFYNGNLEMEVRPDNPDVFRFVDRTESQRKQLVAELTGAKCTSHVTFSTPTNWHIEELLVQPSIDERTQGADDRPIRRTVYSVGTYRSNVNEKYRLVGQNVADPTSGRLRFMSWVTEPVAMDIDRFELSPEMREQLEIFVPEPGQAPLDKCLEIAADMADNVTHIFGRELVHVGYDLLWHSVQSFRAYEAVVTKGWLEAMAVGDTRTGKSEIAQRLISHYRSGQLLSCEGSTFAGLVGGVQQIDGRWHMTWGAIPMNDRRLVVLDEASGIKDANVIEQMSSIRSSGVAQITKITSEETSARTRLLWITNPADGSMLSESMEMGMAALKSVVPNNEDIARFDFVMALARGEVDERMINTLAVPQYRPNYPSEACEALVKWAWSLTPDRVRISRETEHVASELALVLGGRYVPDPPLIQGENVRFKLLRIACAIAARTFSIGPDDELVVLPVHVNDAAQFLDELYSQDSMGYARKSRRAIHLRQVAESEAEKTMTLLKSQPWLMTTLMAVGSTTFRMRDFNEFSGSVAISPMMIQEEVGNLITRGMIRRVDRGAMVMSETLIKILRRLEDEQLAET